MRVPDSPLCNARAHALRPELDRRTLVNPNAARQAPDVARASILERVHAHRRASAQANQRDQRGA
jgi:hypothetical protein